MKDLLIVVTTWLPPGGEAQRLDAFYQAFWSWRDHLKYSGNIRVHIADDGTTEPFRASLIPSRTMKWSITESRGERLGVGASLNRGFADARPNEIVAYFVDDWQLLADLDLDPWMQLMTDNPAAGFVRLGPPHPWITGSVLPVPNTAGSWALHIDRHYYAFSFRPMLMEPQMWRDLGPFPEGESSLEAERIYNERFCNQGIWEAYLALPHPWDHIYTTELSAVKP